MGSVLVVQPKNPTQPQAVGLRIKLRGKLGYLLIFAAFINAALNPNL